MIFVFPICHTAHVICEVPVMLAAIGFPQEKQGTALLAVPFFRLFVYNAIANENVCWMIDVPI